MTLIKILIKKGIQYNVYSLRNRGIQTLEISHYIKEFYSKHNLQISIWLIHKHKVQGKQLPTTSVNVNLG